MENIETAIDIAAPVERVWQVLTGEGLIEQWLGCQGFRGEVGHTFYMQPDAAKRAAGDLSGATHCQVEALEPPHRLAFTWFMPGTPKTLVEITLTASAEGARAALVHSGWDQFAEADIKAVHEALTNGWSLFCLPQLKRIAEAA